jgi:hypothetical protein
MDEHIDRPIFIVGMPRSGTSVFYEKLGGHPDLAWLSRTSKKFPRSPTLTRLFSLVRRDRSPTEAPRVWRRFTRAEDDTLTRAQVTPAQRAYYRQVARAQMQARGAPRFLGKYPRNGLRMDYLDEIFPGCLFIHVIRDGRAVARSIVEMRELHGGRDTYWGIRPPGWRDLVGREYTEAIGRQWTLTIEYIRAHAAPFRPDRYTEVRYEDFCAAPAPTLEKVGAFCGLRWPPGVLENITADVRSCNHKWRSAFTPDEIATLNRTMGGLLKELGYDV